MSSVAPVYFGQCFDAAYDHYRRISSATDLPFMIYSLGADIVPDRDAKFFDLKNVKGMKYTNYKYWTVQALRDRLPKEVIFFAGADEQVLSEPMDVRDPELVTRYEELPLALDEPMSLEEMKKLEENPKSKPYVVHWARETSAKIRRGEKLPREYMYPLQYWKIGDQRLFALGGEVGVGYAMRIKERFGFGTFVAGYCNDIKGYMPTPEMWDEGGYEVVESYMAGGHPGPWKRDVTQRILDAVEKIAQ